VEPPKTPGFSAEELPQDRALRVGAARLSGAVAELPLRYAPFFRRLAELWELPEASVVTELTRAKDPRSWKVTLVRGLRTFDVKRPVTAPAASARARLLRFAPGALLPRHDHRGSETVLVLEGSYADASGVEVHAGESQTMTEHSAHALRILGDAPCVAAVLEHGVDFGLVDLLGTWV
jgi:quercetin dioxygenase-like cupin family protein